MISESASAPSSSAERPHRPGVEFDDAVFGVGVRALPWLSVVPRRLDAVARELAGHVEQALVAATPEELHRYLVERLSSDAVTAVETAPVLRTLKSAEPVDPR